MIHTKRKYRRQAKRARTDQLFTFAVGDFKILRRSADILEVETPTDTKVIVNGKIFCDKSPVERIVYKGGSTFQETQFQEVDRLVEERGLKKIAAFEVVSDKYGFDLNSFRQQYYKRWFNKTITFKDRRSKEVFTHGKEAFISDSMDSR